MLTGAIVFIGLIVWLVSQNRRLKTLEDQLLSLRQQVLLLKATGPANTVEDAPSAGDETEARAAIAATSPEEAMASEPDDQELEDRESEEETAGPWSHSGVFDQPPPLPVTAKAASRPDLETALGTRWAVWVGGIALALGGIFLVRYSIEAGFFGPGMRLTIAALFGLALAGAGEVLRRTGFQVPIQGIANAYIPAILTAAGAFTLFGTVYAAHGIYGFIGPTAAFVLMGLIGLGTIGLSLLHGQPLAGLGLLGSMATPVLVASTAPNMWSLFGYLSIVLAGAGAIARLRNWKFLMAASFAGFGMWIALYLVDGGSAVQSVLTAFTAAVVLAVLALIWLWNRTEEKQPLADAPSVIAALVVGLPALALFSSFYGDGQSWWGVALFAAMIGVAAWRERALALLFVAGAFSLGYFHLLVDSAFSFYAQVPVAGPDMRGPGAALGLVFLGAGLWMARRFAGQDTLRSVSWAGWAAGAPVAFLTALWLIYGDLYVDLRYAAIAFALTAALVVGGEWIASAEEPPRTGGYAVSAAYLGAGAALVLSLHAAFGPGLTTVLVGAAIALPAVATRWRSYPVLGWLSVAFALVVVARVLYDPTIVGAGLLQLTPVFNWLLPGYGVPALASAFAAVQLSRTTDGRPRMIMEVAAVLFGALTLAMLVRHAMHGGVIDDGPVTLAEQAIYTLIALGLGGMLAALDQRAPSSVLRIGSMIAGVASVLSILLAHFVILNPLLTDESTGSIPLFNLLFLAYLLPAIAAGALALYVRYKRPAWYVRMLALTAALLAFAYATLSVRRYFVGEYIGQWHGFSQAENYSYSALWLTLGVILLVVGVRLRADVLRLASAALIVLAVLKVFLLDMANLEGAWRALSFIGLGLVLIGIGLFYQRLLSSQSKQG